MTISRNRDLRVLNIFLVYIIYFYPITIIPAREEGCEHSLLNTYGIGLEGGPLDATFCTDVTLPLFPPPTKGRAYAISKATSSSPKKTVRRDLESARAKVGVYFVGSRLFFTLGSWGF